jgi:hypothetical protein
LNDQSTSPACLSPACAGCHWLCQCFFRTTKKCGQNEYRTGQLAHSIRRMLGPGTEIPPPFGERLGEGPSPFHICKAVHIKPRACPARRGVFAIDVNIAPTISWPENCCNIASSPRDGHN